MSWSCTSCRSLLGAGERLLENVGTPRLRPVEVLGSPLATHVTYRAGQGSAPGRI